MRGNDVPAVFSLKELDGDYVFLSLLLPCYVLALVVLVYTALSVTGLLLEHGVRLVPPR